MTRRAMMVLAGLLLALPMGATVAVADEGGRAERETGNACPERSPDEDGDGDPACGRIGHDKGHDDDAGRGSGADQGDRGHRGQGADHGDRGHHGQGADQGDRGNRGQGGDGHGNDGRGNDGQDGQDGADGADACPATSPNAGKDRPCGNAGDGGTTPEPADPGTGDGGEGGDGVDAAADPCSAEVGDVGILTPDTLAQTLADAGLADIDPLFEDPDADGPLSGAIYDGGNGTEIEVITDEAGCIVDLIINGTSLGFDV